MGISPPPGLRGKGRRLFRWTCASRRARRSSPVPGAGTVRGARRAAPVLETLAEVPEGDAAARFLVERAGAALASYEAAKGSGLDFMDLLLRASDLLAGNPAVARRLGDRFRYIFVDEFQDTDPLQAGVLRAIAADAAPGRLFVVGDPKQSIYGFRRADIQVYRKFREGMVDAGGEDVPLSRNFRSRPDLLATLSGIFSRVLSGGEDFSPAYAHVVADRNDPGEGHPVSLYRLDPGVDEAEFLAGLVGRIAGSVKVRIATVSNAPRRSGTSPSSTAPTPRAICCRGIARRSRPRGSPTSSPRARGSSCGRRSRICGWCSPPSMSPPTFRRGTPP